MPLLWISTAFLFGVFTGWLFGGLITIWLTVIEFIAFILVLLGYWLVRFTSHRSSWSSRLADLWPADQEALLPGFILPLIPLALLSGGIRYHASLPRLNDSFIAWYNDWPQQIEVEGIIADDPEFRDSYTLIKVQTDQLKLAADGAENRVEGRLQVRLPAGGDWRYGDRLLLVGRLRAPADGDNNSYKNYLAQHGIYSTLTCTSCLPCSATHQKSCYQLLERDQGSKVRGAIFAVRRKALFVLYAIFPNPEAGLLAGILLGVETGISPNVLDAFRQTGTSHIIAISGFNFAIISGLLVWVFSHLLGRWRSLPAAWIGIGAYAVLAGASAGVIRAAIMGSFSIFAVRIGRRSSGLNMLAVVAGLMAIADPHILWDVSFQLSFMATLGLILYAEPLESGFARLASRWLEPERAAQLAQPVADYILFTFAAQLTTLPLILYYFRRVSLISLVVNPLILPVQPPLMIMGGISTVSAMIIPQFGQFLAGFEWPWLAYTIRVVEVLAGASRSGITVETVSLWWVTGFYFLLFAITLIGPRLRELVGRITGDTVSRLGWVLTIGFALLALVCWQRVFVLPDGRLHLTMLDVGDGDGFLIQTPAGQYVLVDGGSSANLLADALGRRLTFGQPEIDYLVVAATGENQIASLPLAMDHFRVRNVLWSGPIEGSYSARELQKRLVQDQIPVIEAKQGQKLDLGDGAYLEVISASARGAILLLEWDRFRVLLPIGLDFESQEALLRDARFTPVTALLLAEGGISTLNSKEWMIHWKPQLALLSVAAGNEEGLPHPETLKALDGIPLLRTDQDGWIELSTDGEQLWVEVERK